MTSKEVLQLKTEIEQYLQTKLLPFWMARCKDEANGGFVTHFDKEGNDTGEDEKSLIAQSRTVYTMASAHRAGYGQGKCAVLAKHGVDFLINRMWDAEFGGFYWMMDRRGSVQIDAKILYGHSFAIYALSEYVLATLDNRGLDYAQRTFDLVQKYCVDTMYGGYFEMFDRSWNLAGPGSKGGDRKTLDVHMHLMEAYTTLFEASREEIHRRKLLEVIELLIQRMLHPRYATGIPQFYQDWKVAPQIKFDIVWGWDRFSQDKVKSNAEDNTSYGHNTEFFWLLLHALDILGTEPEPYLDKLRSILDHTVNNGIDFDYGGVYVEGSHGGTVYDREKEFWQQAEAMIGMLDGCLLFGDQRYWETYRNIHRFVFDKVINHAIGEWWPLLTREGEPIWTHMSHSWKINYHSVRAMIQCSRRLEELAKTMDE